MSASVAALFPLVKLQAVSDIRHEWVALQLSLGQEAGCAISAYTALFSAPDVRAALAPMALLLPLDTGRAPDDPLLALLPAESTIFCLSADTGRDFQERCGALRRKGFRTVFDGALAAPQGDGIVVDCGPGLPAGWLASAGLQVARGVDTPDRFAQCRAAGFTWFSGRHQFHSSGGDAGPTRHGLLNLLALLARDADARELESLLKQDPALSYQLLKLVNSAAFSHGTQITSFAQAIALLGRRQLQRWLQLLLYARPEAQAPNGLLPHAAVRAAQMESLCKLAGGSRAQQDLAFMVGVFSLLDILFGQDMGQLLQALELDSAVCGALLAREGELGKLLALVEREQVAEADLRQLGVDHAEYWDSLLQAYHWAIQVARNL